MGFLYKIDLRHQENIKELLEFDTLNQKTAKSSTLLIRQKI